MKSRERTSSVLVCWVTFVFAWTAISMLTISTGVGAKTRLDNASDSAAIRFREKMKLPAPKRVSGIKLPLSSAREGRKQFIVQLRTLPVAKAVARGRNVSARQIAHHRQLQAEQTAFMAYCNQFGAKVVGRTQVVLNAVFLEADMANLPEIAKYDAVMSIRAIRNYQIFLSETVPYIGASDVQAAGFDGSGIRIAVLDSGIDYTHAHFAGPGTREAYEAAYGTDLADPRNTRRDALFPTAKVVGGFDFVGEFWDGSDTSPPLLPDADPIDAEGHGTHVADIIGGLNGVAPGAELYAVKVCSSVAPACSGVALIQGMEFAVDPNGDGDTSDAVDIVNMSLGSDYGQPFDDDLAAAVDNAFQLGVLTVASAGNSADQPYAIGTPAAASTALSVAQTQVPSAVLQFMEILEPPAAAGNVGAVFQPWAGALKETIDGPVTYGDGAGGNLDGCAPFTVPVSGIVLVDRGSCAFGDKIRHIEQAGGALGIIGLIAPGEPFPGGFAGGSPITIPAYMISQASGDVLRTGGAMVRFDPNNSAPLVMSMVSSSSRGPANQSNAIKPEIGAPGAPVSAEVGTGTGQTPFGGTSGAAPMVTGAAALLMHVYRDRPTVGPGDIKQLLINTGETAIRNRVSSGGADDLASITRIGGGEVRVERAVATPSTAFVVDTPGHGGISFGFLDVADSQVTHTQTIGVRNLFGTEPITYEITTSLRFADDVDNGAVTLSADTSWVTVPPGQTGQFELTLAIEGALLRSNVMNSGTQGNNPAALTLNEYDGFVSLTSADAPTIQLPWQVLPRQAARVEPMRTQLNFSASDQDTIELQNQGIGTAQLDAYTLLALSAERASGDRGAQMPTPDIRAVGVQTLIVPADVCTSQFLWAFAINSWERQTHLVPVSYEVWLETTQDGIPDFVVLNRDITFDNVSSGQQLSWVVNLSTATAEVLFFAEHATNTGNTVLLICGEQVGLSAADLQTTNVDVFVVATDFYFGGPGDTVSGLTIRPQGERFVAETSDIPGNSTGTMTVTDLGPSSGTSDALGILLFTNGSRGAGSHGGATQETEALIFMTQ